MSYQGTEGTVLVFEAIKRSKRTRNKIFIKSQKIPVSSFIALNQAKEQGINVIKAQKLAALVFEVRNEVKEPETKLLLTHRTCCFSFLSHEQSKRTRNKCLIKA